MSGWIYRVAVNLGYNALRSKRRRKRYEMDAGRLALENRASPSPEQEVGQKIKREHVRRVLKRMPSRPAKLLILRHYGLSYREIAETLNVSTSSVGKLLNRAEKVFIKHYKRGEEDASER